MGYEVFLCVDKDDLEPKLEQIAHLEAVIQEAVICPTIENDGIGAYEFWGDRRFDHGTDRLIVEPGEDIAVRVLVHGAEEPELPAIAARIEKEIFADVDNTRAVRFGGLIGTAKALFVERKTEAEGGNAVFTYDVEWETGEDFEADL